MRAPYKPEPTCSVELKCEWYTYIPGGSFTVNSYAQALPGITAGCVTYGTPSTAFGTVIPWKCSAVGCAIWFTSTNPTRSPYSTRISGPGTCSLNAIAVTNCPFETSHRT